MWDWVVADLRMTCVVGEDSDSDSQRLAGVYYSSMNGGISGLILY